MPLFDGCRSPIVAVDVVANPREEPSWIPVAFQQEFG
jgi:hypothetical protein